MRSIPMKEYGFSLIEVMVTSFVLAVGLLGLAGMQSTAIKSNIEIQQRSLANTLLADMAERMQLNRLWLSEPGNNYALTSLMNSNISAPSCVSAGGTFSDCSGEQIKANDLFEWKKKLLGTEITSTSGIQQGLIGADACIESDGSGNNTIVLSWYSTVKNKDAASNAFTGSIQANCGSASAHRRQLSVTTYISKAS